MTDDAATDQWGEAPYAASEVAEEGWIVGRTGPGNTTRQTVWWRQLHDDESVTVGGEQ